MKYRLDINKLLEESFKREFNNAKKQREAEEAQANAIQKVYSDVSYVVVCVN